MPLTLPKAERLHRKKLIGKLFEGGAHSFSLFPLRVVWLPVDEQESPAAILVSVSKRKFKRAVKRNRVKRQVRESWRLNKALLCPVLQHSGQRIIIAFIYLSDRLLPTSLIEERVKTSLCRIAERVEAASSRKETAENVQTS